MEIGPIRKNKRGSGESPKERMVCGGRGKIKEMYLQMKENKGMQPKVIVVMLCDFHLPPCHHQGGARTIEIGPIRNQNLIFWPLPNVL